MFVKETWCKDVDDSLSEPRRPEAFVPSSGDAQRKDLVRKGAVLSAAGFLGVAEGKGAQSGRAPYICGTLGILPADKRRFSALCLSGEAAFLFGRRTRGILSRFL